jgi:hypothetical protein
MRKAWLRITTDTEDRSRKSIVVLIFILLAAGLISTLHAIAKPFWYDEICTVIVCRLSSASDIWKALSHAVDTNPPFYYLVAHFARQLVPEDHLGYRLPSILGLLGTIFCIYKFVSRRSSRLSALVGATFILCTPLAEYAYEARPYSLMIACISCAILAWQRIDKSRLYVILVAFGLAAAISLHYYALLVWPVFFIAEASVWIFHRHFRVSAWASIIVGALPMILFSTLLLKLRDYYGQNFWAHINFKQIIIADSWLFNLGGNWGLILVAGLSALILYFSITRSDTPASSDHKEGEQKALPIEERMLILTLLWLPLIAIAVARIGHGGMTERYMLPTILGGALAVGYLSDKLPRAAGALLLALLMIYYALSSFHDVSSALRGSLLEPRNAATHELQTIAAADDQAGLPIVIANGVRYLPMAYYTRAESNRMLYFIADPAAAVRLSSNKSDSLDKALLVLKHYAPLNVEDYDGFVSMHREFLLVTDAGGGPIEDFEWLPARLTHDGYVVRLLSVNNGTQVYKVTITP